MLNYSSKAYEILTINYFPENPSVVEENEPILKMRSRVKCTQPTKVIIKLIKLILTSISLLTLTFSSVFFRFSCALFFSSEKRCLLEKKNKNK